MAHSKFCRMRLANFSRFTIDRLITILHRLGQEVEVSVAVHPSRTAPAALAQLALSA